MICDLGNRAYLNAAYISDASAVCHFLNVELLFLTYIKGIKFIFPLYGHF